jgi:hypothetical protein
MIYHVYWGNEHCLKRKAKGRRPLEGIGAVWRKILDRYIS